MENKYNELEKLNQLKANGTITDTEFEIEKQKILNSKSNKTPTKKKKSKLLFIVIAVVLIAVIVLGIFGTKFIKTEIQISQTEEKLANINSEELQKQIIEELEHTNLNINITANPLYIYTYFEEGVKFEGYITAKIGCVQNNNVIGLIEIPCFKINSDSNGKFISIEYNKNLFGIKQAVVETFKTKYDIDFTIVGNEKYCNRFNEEVSKSGETNSGEIYCSDNEFFIMVLKRYDESYKNFSVNDYDSNKDFFDNLKIYQTTTFGLEF